MFVDVVTSGGDCEGVMTVAVLVKGFEGCGGEICSPDGCATEVMVPLILCEELVRPSDETGLEGNTEKIEFPNTFVVPEALDWETRPVNAFPVEVAEAAVGAVKADNPGKSFESHCGGVAFTGVGAMGGVRGSLNDSASSQI